MMKIKSLIKDFSVYGIGNFVCKAVSFLVFPLYTYVLTVEDFGVMELVNTGVGIVSILINLGLSNAVQRYYYDNNIANKDKSIIISSGFFCMAVLGLGILLLSIIGIYYIYNKILYYEYSIPLILVLIALMNVYIFQHMYYCMDVMRLHFKSWQFTLISCMSSLLTVGFTILSLFYLNAGVLGCFLASMIANVFTIIFATYFIRCDLTLNFDFIWCKKLLIYGLPIMCAGLFYVALSAVDRWLLMVYANVDQIGLYSIGFKFANIIIFINNAMFQAFMPFCMKMYLEDSKYKIKISQIYSYYICFLSFLAAIISLFSKEILTLLVSEDFWSSYNILSILVIGMVMYASTNYSSIGITFAKKTKYMTYVSFMTVLLNIFLNYIFIPKYYAIGAAIAMCISYLAMTILYFYITYRIHYIPFSMKINFYCLFTMVCSMLLGNFIEQTHVDMYILFIKIFILLFLFSPLVYALYRNYKVSFSDL